jgi:hypothetical protein
VQSIDDASHFLTSKRKVVVGSSAALFLALLTPLSAEGRSSADTRSAAAAADDRLFADTSAFNNPIGGNVTLDPNSSAMVANLSSGDRPGIANTGDFGYPIYYADASTPRYRIDCTMDWGRCDLENEPVPIPGNARANKGSDGKLQIIDLTSGKAYELWQYRNDFATASWGHINSDIHNGDGRPGATGAGVSQIAGIVRLSEVRAGVIDHALTFSTRFCQGPGDGPNYRYPATKSDGKWHGTGAVPEGARIQLDPAVNVDAIPGITPGEKMIARALQKYGAYAVDCGVASMAFGFESPKLELSPYLAIGFPWDYFAMDRIPWNRLRVLAAWDSHSAAAPTTTTSPPPTTTTVAPPPTPAPSTAAPPPSRPVVADPPVWAHRMRSWFMWLATCLRG